MKPLTQFKKISILPVLIALTFVVAVPARATPPVRRRAYELTRRRSADSQSRKAVAAWIAIRACNVITWDPERLRRNRRFNRGLPRAAKPQPKLSFQMTQTEGSEENEEVFLWRSEPFVSFVSFCKKLLRASQAEKSSQVATNLAYSSADNTDGSRRNAAHETL